MTYLSIRDLSVRLRNGPPLLRRVSLDVEAGEVRALVGESGAGKSMIGKAVLGILPPSVEISGGQILLDGTDLLTLPPKDRRRRIGASCALIPQDPLTALNPSHRIGPQITDRLVDILGWTRADAEARAKALLAEVQIPDPDRVLRAYPHELSGGMRQRILIASAFAAEPKLIVADEPTTALDVTVQRQVLDLFRDLRRELGTALVLITHDLGVVAGLCDRVAVMYAGRVVERATTDRLFAAPRHPYGAGLLAAMPRVDERPDRPLGTIPGAPPDLRRPPAGCAFRPRCARAAADCAVAPALVGDERDAVACHRPLAGPAAVDGAPGAP
ncbi:MAG: ABC transporter ATP-binding protein [Steroidobacteraceae bacterium]|nr:ABC transporter ATP-binding protein [Steroidobacteraceae bacterium]